VNHYSIHIKVNSEATEVLGATVTEFNYDDTVRYANKMAWVIRQYHGRTFMWGTCSSWMKE
jgi:hypothetical protein